MKKWKTKSGVEIIQVLDGRSNSYLICSEKGNILVDSGKTAVFVRLQKNIKALKLPEKHIDLLILTHTHFDHCQNAKAVKGQYQCKIIVSEKEADFTQNGYTPLPRGTFAFSLFLSKIGSRIGKRRFGYQPFDVDKKISGETILDGFPVKIIPTPGHSEGSLSVIADNEIALVGDAMFGIFGNSVFPPFADDVPEMVKSWGALLSTNCHTFLPGHGKEIKRNLLQREFLKHSEKIKQ